MGEFLTLAVVLLLALGGYWAMITFPRQRDFQKRQNMARELAENDEVITAGGLVGKIKRIESDKGIAYLEVTEGIEVRIVIAAILERYNPDEIAEQARKGQLANDKPIH